MTALFVTDQPAGLFRRLASLAYDWMLLSGIWILIAFVAVALKSWLQLALSDAPGLVPQPVLGGWFQLLLWSATVLYFSLFWWRRGQTPGMSAWRIMVCGAGDHEPPGYARAFTRALLAPCSALCLGLGYLWCTLPASRGHCWHDRLSATRVLCLELHHTGSRS